MRRGIIFLNNMGYTDFHKKQKTHPIKMGCVFCLPFDYVGITLRP